MLRIGCESGFGLTDARRPEPRDGDRRAVGAARRRSAAAPSGFPGVALELGVFTSQQGNEGLLRPGKPPSL